MSEDLDLAAQVHYSFLPEDYEDDRISIAVSLRPLFPIGGDYCSVLLLDDRRLLVCMCDAVGHGTAAALFASRINTYVLTHAHLHPSVCNLTEGLNAYLCQRLGETGIYTSFYAPLLDLEAGCMSFIGAAHPPLLQYDKEQGICRQWPSAATFLGIMDPMPLDCCDNTIFLRPGDRFLLYTDGLIEVEGAEQELFGTERLASVLTDHHHLSGQKLNGAVIDQTADFAADGFNDDVLLLSMTLK